MRSRQFEVMCKIGNGDRNFVSICVITFHCKEFKKKVMVSCQDNYSWGRRVWSWNMVK